MRGIAIPADTVFLPALHDTTTDEMRILERGRVPATHAEDLRHIEALLAAAGGRARARARASPGPPAGADVDQEIAGRARDWSQTRPEWGLAGCAAFLVAPRRRSRGVDLGGRVFLHSYDWRRDAGLRRSWSRS